MANENGDGSKLDQYLKRQSGEAAAEPSQHVPLGGGAAPPTGASAGFKIPPATPGIDLNLGAAPAGEILGPAGFWIRFPAVLIDGIIVAVVTVPIRIPIMAAVKLGIGGSGVAALGVLSMLVNLVVSYFYFGWFYHNRGATPGKMAMGLKVLNSTNGMRLTYGKAFAREVVGKFLSSVILFIGFMMAGFRADKKALHDLVFGTQVVRVRK